jgi:hypothetical protein
LCVALSSLSEQAQRLENVMFPDMDATVLVDYTSLRNSSVNESTGRMETSIVAPIDSEVADTITEKLGAFEGTACSAGRNAGLHMVRKPC